MAARKQRLRKGPWTSYSAQGHSQWPIPPTKLHLGKFPLPPSTAIKFWIYQWISPWAKSEPSRPFPSPDSHLWTLLCWEPSFQYMKCFGGGTLHTQNIAQCLKWRPQGLGTGVLAWAAIGDWLIQLFRGAGSENSKGSPKVTLSPPYFRSSGLSYKYRVPCASQHREMGCTALRRHS
jgi:hypothetical protein